MNNLEIQRETLKELYDKTMGKYEMALIRDFECGNEKCNSLDNFFENTYESVITTLFANYHKMLIKRNSTNEFKKIQISTPLIVIGNLSKEERQYLLSLYINKLIELDMDSLGLTSVNILKKWQSKDHIPDEIIYGEDKNIYKSGNLYVLETEFSLMKSFAQREVQKNHGKKYVRMIEE